MKTAHPIPSCVKTHLFRSILVALSVLMLAGAALWQQPATAQKAGADPAKLYLDRERAVSVTYAGKAPSVQAMSSGQAKPLSLASGDFDGDGVEDVIAGFASGSGGLLVIHRGNIDAFAPQSQASFLAIGEGRFPNPFLPEAKVVEVPQAPDFLITGSFEGDGRMEIAFATKGSNTLYILAGDGKGGFLQPRAIPLGGTITTLGTERFDVSAAVVTAVVPG